MLTADQREEFRTTGLLRLAAAFPRAGAATMVEGLWDFLAERYAIRREERSTWTVTQPTGFQPVTHSGAFRGVGSDVLCGALDSLLGTGRWARPRWWGRPLVTFPGEGPWQLPVRGWHCDFMPATDRRRPVQVFAFVDEVRPRGGGTLVLTGSHRLVAPLLDRGGVRGLEQVRERLATHPWIRRLWEPGDNGDRIQRYMVDGTVVDGVPLRVVELTGEPGDAILMHCDCFHAAAPNCRTEPRMMLTEMIRPHVPR